MIPRNVANRFAKPLRPLQDCNYYYYYHYDH